MPLGPLCIMDRENGIRRISSGAKRFLLLEKGRKSNLNDPNRRKEKKESIPRGMLKSLFVG